MTSAILLLGLLACGAAEIGDTGPVDDTGTTTDTDTPTGVYGETVYDLDRLLRVEITLDPDDWNELRYQARNFIDMLTGDCLAEPFGSPYTWFEAEVTVDGTTLENVAVRKKGLLGSVVSDRPSLKLSFDRFEEGQLYEGVERLTLNNSRQDASRVKTCLGYGIYADAGLPGSRCSYAHVTVNGQDLGVYANVEPIKKDMLRRVFGDDSGNLYEGTLSDFLDGWTGTFDQKTGDGDRSDLEGVVEALEVQGDGFEAAVDAVIDLDEFFDAWSLEALIGHWDSYTGNRNNFFAYADPADGRFRFLPWGIDAILQGEEPFGAGRPTSVTGEATLPSRILGHPHLVDRYYDHLVGHLDEVWDEDVLLDRVDHAEALTAEWAWPNGGDNGTHASTLEAIRDFIAGRRDQVLAEWAAGPPDAALGDPGDVCLEVVGTVDLSFSSSQGSYGSLPTFGTGSGSWSLTLSGAPTPVTFLSAVLGEWDGYGMFVVSGTLSDGTNIAVYGYTNDPALLDQPGTIDLDWSQAVSYLIVDSAGTLQDREITAYVGGELTLTEADDTPGTPLVGSFDLDILG